MQIDMSSQEYDNMVADFAKQKAPCVWPSLDVIDSMIEKTKDDPEEFKKWVMYCCYLIEKGKVKTKTESYSKKTLNLFLYEALVIT